MGFMLWFGPRHASAEIVPLVRSIEVQAWVTDIAYHNGHLYYSEEETNTIQVLPVSSLKAAAVAKPALYAKGFKKPQGITVDPQGNLYVADSEANSIYKVASNGTTTIYAGEGTPGFRDGTKNSARFHGPSDVAWGKDGALYVADTLNHRIRKIDASGQVSTVAGGGDQVDEDGFPIGSDQDGRGTAARLNEPTSLSFSPTGELYFTDTGNQRIRFITREGEVKTLAGSGTEMVENRYRKGGYQDGKAAAAKFHSPLGIEVGADGTVYVADTYNHMIRAISPVGQVSTLAGRDSNGMVNGWGMNARFDGPVGVELLPDHSLLIADHWNRSLRHINLIRLPDRTALDDIRLVVDSSPLLLKHKPLLVDGMAWVPLREMVERWQGTVSYHPVTRKIAVVRDGKPIPLKSESTRLIGGVTYVKASELPSLFDVRVNWVSSYKLLDIQRKTSH